MRYIAQYPFRRAGNDYLVKLSTGEAKFSDPIGLESARFVADIGKYFQTGFSFGRCFHFMALSQEEFFKTMTQLGVIIHNQYFSQIKLQ